MKVAFIGLGGMGAPMAGHLAAGGHEVVVFNRTRARTDAWLAKHHGTSAPTPAAAVSGAKIAFVCVTDDLALDAVLQGSDGILAGLAPGAVIVDHGSGSPTCARQNAAKAHAREVGYLDAPVSGGQRGATAGTLAVMVGGNQRDLTIAEPVMRAYARDVTPMGDVGAGHLTKLVNVIIGMGTGLAVAEGLGFAMRAGLDAARVRDVLLPGSSQSWQFQHRGAAMVAADYTPLYAVALGLKDLGNARAAGEGVGATLPMTCLGEDIYRALAKAGGKERDVASAIEYFFPRAFERIG
jgi:3-hydroxyisobutyrate dehydrogenase/2-hydroxy-3-oxopropionate reductase